MPLPGYLRRLAPAGIGWPVPDAFADAVLEAHLFVRSVAKRGCREPDCAAMRLQAGSPSSKENPDPSRVFAPVSAFFACAKATGLITSKPLAV